MTEPAAPESVTPTQLEAARDAMLRALGDAITGSDIRYGELVLTTTTAQVVRVLTWLQGDAGLRFTQLVDVTAVDYPARAERFEVVYHLLSLTHNLRVRVKCSVADGASVPSVSAIYPAANWYEREVFDMYGIAFSGHPDLRRILTDYGFEGNPLRKDFPLTGYVEMRYDPAQQKVVYEPVKLPQAFRSFDFESPWEGMDRLLPGDKKAS